MTQIFIFTAGNSSARSHLDDSIINPIDFKKVEKRNTQFLVNLFFRDFCSGVPKKGICMYVELKD